MQFKFQFINHIFFLFFKNHLRNVVIGQNTRYFDLMYRTGAYKVLQRHCNHQITNSFYHLPTYLENAALHFSLAY